MKKHIITISGIAGCGKSSTATRVAENLGYEHFSSGDLMRKVAIERSVSLEELLHAAKTDPTIDEAVDQKLRDLGERDDLVVDSRIAYHWIPKSFKVFLHIDPETAASRTYHQLQTTGRIGQEAASEEEVRDRLVERIAGDRTRYMSLYNGLDYTDETQYDLVVDTVKYSLEEAANIVTDHYRAWLAQ